MPADIPVATTAVVRRFRGKSRAPNFVYRGPVSVIRLELEVCDDRARRRLERQWVAVFRLRRALQRDAADRCRAYWAAHRERARDPKALRERLGLTRKGIESAAKAHVEASGWMRDHLTKAVGLHVADEVWETIGALAVVFTGLAGGDVVLPVRLPQGAAQWAHLTHFLADPTVWHKIDLVRVRDRRAPGGWRYYAHLLVHQAGYQSVATQARRAQIPGDRRAGIDANVSNLALASFPEPQPEQLVIDKVGCTTEQQQAAEKAARRARARQRALDRSRRNTNPDQYGPSVRQAARAARRADAGLPAKHVTNPGGARRARADGVPLRGYRHDSLSHGYQRTRADHAVDSRAASQAKHARAREVAARIVATHGAVITVEDCSISTWARLWGKRIALFSPGMLVTALAAECAAAGGRLHRAGTRSTALSQHCLCGQRVPKTLAQRIHDCPHCSLHLDRDVASAALAACVELTDAEDPRSARVNYRLARALRAGLASQQEQEGSVNRHQPPAAPATGPARTGSRHPVAPAEQRTHHSAHPRTDQHNHLDVTGPAENNSPTTCLVMHGPLRVSS